jgi:hypothetical protein
MSTHDTPAMLTHRLVRTLGAVRALVGLDLEVPPERSSACSVRTDPARRRSVSLKKVAGKAS